MYIIDFEASSLSRNSYPIEVAWGSSRETVTTFLLNPDKMTGWTDWSSKSFEFHGIQRNQLLECGEDPKQVAKILVRDLAGKSVYSDEPRFDNMWKDRLLSDTGYDPSLIRIKNLKYYLNKMIKVHSPRKKFNDVFEEFTSKKSIHHRAGSDVKWLLEFVEFVKELDEKMSN